MTTDLLDTDNNLDLIIAEIFGDTQPTFQGEGPSAGTPALFIRLSRCNISCGWCDTKHTWDWDTFDVKKESHKRTVDELASWALGQDVELVVISGGEPLLQQPKLVPLVQRLLAGGKRIEFETNGTITPVPELLVDGVRFNVSPKLANSDVAEHKRIVPEALRTFAANGRAIFKFVTRAVDELDEIGRYAEEFGLAPVYVMPEGTTAQGLMATTRVLADAVPARGWHLTQRMHIFAFGDKRGR